MSTEDGSPENLEEVVDQLSDKAEEEDDTITVREALDAFEGRVFGPLLVLPALIVLTPPVGMIPFVPSIMAAVIVLISVQYLFGRTHPWLPDFIGARGVSQKKFLAAMDKGRPWAKWIDGFFGERFQFLVTGPMEHGIAAVCTVVALSMPASEFVPGLAAVPALAILILGLAITARDGLIGLVGFLVAAGGVGYLVYYLVTKFM